MLSCRELTEQADAFLDKEMPFGKRMQVRLHVMMCGGCNRFVNQMRLTRRLITAEERRKTVHDTANIDSILAAFEEEK
ncbi:zf-HC2 domain-containing protein [Falsihalocynthiibacter arcticus]|uniref:Putative zinc-finger domain-containing protein n=1 Tax=Falsihalocynthiibacter arcticus TaxID=1579316 RepID=A0A126V3Y5_9RHOB|nr:zf-HC2 domain-containing protein [Falsihalocynthiibacter arcticus]AML53032.1 hypothetical protein RC74_18780 [Falsihalocynthiibacter arcticus]